MNTESKPDMNPEITPEIDHRHFRNLIASAPKRDRAVGSAFVSLILHTLFGALAVWFTLNSGLQAAEDEVSMIDLAEEPPTPEAPELPPAPPPPPIEVEVRGFQVLSEPTFITPNIPAPGALGVFREEDFSGLGVERGRATDDSTEVDIAAAPRFTPFTVRPELKNREDVARALERLYPPLLRDSGIGGTVVVWVFIDEEGRVVRAQVNQTSNLEPLDQAALAVADVMEFSPAMNRENRVRVWIQIPITFQTR
ncbi:MAG: energy transducer TonB [Gemmatimonadetes bacterium]|nr:energy transducer TonB [Gemmatimonadota bacterium]